MLLKHNAKTYVKFERMLRERKMCCLVSDPGTGKSNISMEFVSRHNLKTLVICPTNALRSAWEENSIKYGVGNIYTVTYMTFARNYIDYRNFDCYIFDEAHRTEGLKWGQAIREFKRSVEAKHPYIIGLTATPKRYSDGIDVSETMFNKNVVTGLKYSTAIEKGLIPRAEYICSVFDTDKLYEELSDMELSETLSGRLKYCMENTMKMSECMLKHMPENPKGIVFVDRISTIDNAIDLINDIFPTLPLFCIHSGNRKEKNDRILEMFKKSKTGMMITVNMLNEGIHLDDINTLIMLRKTRSSTIYTQQLGRGLHINSTGLTVFDFVGNNSSLVLNTPLSERIRNYSKYDTGAGEIETFSNQFILYNYMEDIVNILRDIYAEQRDLWTEREDNIIRENYGNMSIEELQKLIPNRTITAISIRASKIRVSKSSKWTEREDNIIRENYASTAIGILQKMLPNRSAQSIKIRASKLGVLKCVKWTEMEDNIIRENYGNMSIEELQKLIPNRSIASIFTRASSIGVRKQERWTKAEDDILRKYHGCMSVKDIQKFIPNRSIRSIMYRLEFIGLIKYKKWTKEEDDILRNNHLRLSVDEIAKYFKLRSKIAIIGRLKHLKLSYFIDRGV